MIKEKILKDLYILKEMSMKDISKKLDVGEHQVDYWMRKYNIKTRSISNAVYLKYNKNGDPFKIPTFLKKENIYRDQKFLYGLGLGLYWGEGTRKSKNSVRLGNSDPQLIKKFIEFLVKIFNIKKSKLRFSLQIFSDVEEKVALNHWKKILKFPKKHFYRSIITKSIKPGTYKYKSKYGVLTLHFANTKLKNFIFEKISQL